MTTAYLVSLSALWCAAGAAAAWKLTALHFRSRLSEATTSEARYRALWERDSGKMLIAQASLDLIHQQHVDAGRKAHETWFAARDRRTELLREANAARQLNTLPAAFPEPATGFPADLSAGRKESRRRQVAPHSGQDTGAGILPDVTPRASDRNAPVDTCSRNRAGHPAPAENPPSMKGAI